MARRLWHFFFGHNWRERDVVFNPSNISFIPCMTFDSERFRVYGFTDITLMCTCGALKVHRLVGQHAPSGDSEVEQLRKMAGLSPETERRG